MIVIGPWTCIHLVLCLATLGTIRIDNCLRMRDGEQIPPLSMASVV